MSIDYDRMQREFPKQKRALTLALKTGNIAKVAETTAKTIVAWNEIGSWPDDWHRWQIALDDTFWEHKQRYMRRETDVEPRYVDMDELASYLATAGNDVSVTLQRMGLTHGA